MYLQFLRAVSVVLMRPTPVRLLHFLHCATLSLPVSPISGNTFQSCWTDSGQRNVLLGGESSPSQVCGMSSCFFGGLQITVYFRGSLEFCLSPTEFVCPASGARTGLF